MGGEVRGGLGLGRDEAALGGLAEEEESVVERGWAIGASLLVKDDGRVVVGGEAAVQVHALAAAAGDVEEEVDRPERRGEGVADAALAAAGCRVAFADAERDAGGLGVGELDRPVVGILLAEQLLDRGETLGLRVGLGRGQRVDVRSRQDDAVLEVGHEERHPFRALGHGGSGQRRLGVQGDDGVGGRGELGLVLRVAPVAGANAFALRALRVEVGFVADLDGQDFLGADLERVGGFGGGHLRVVGAEVDAVDHLPARRAREVEERVDGLRPDRARVGHVAVILHRLQRRVGVGLVERRVDIVGTDPPDPWAERAAQRDELRVLAVEAVARHQLLLGAQPDEVGGDG